MIQGTDAPDMVLDIFRPNSTGNKNIVGDNEGPLSLFTKSERESNFFYMFDVKTVTIAKKTNQAMMFPNIMMLFMYIQELVRLISY